MDGLIDAVLHVDGTHAAFSSADPQQDLHRLLGWADDHRIALRRFQGESQFARGPVRILGGSDADAGTDTDDARDQEAATR